MNRKQCDICQGSRIIRLPVHKPVMVLPSHITEPFDTAVRVYPCPECGLKVDTDKLAVLDVHSRAGIRYENETGYQEYVQRNLAYLLAEELLRRGYIAFEKGEADNDQMQRYIIASLGVVSKSQVATLEQRVARNQDKLANVVINEAIKQIDNWGSHYGRTTITKDDATRLIRDAASFVRESWSKVLALTEQNG